MRALLLAFSLLLAAPALAEDTQPAPAAEPTQPAPAQPAGKLDCAVVTLPTSDGLKLVADHCPASPGAPVVVLLHMIPPHHDRTNYPGPFRSKLVDAGIEVLNLDRRGGGDSEGVAKEAYTGPNGVRDVQAALDWLRANSTADLSSWACVGASNGTTTCLDYAVRAADGEGLVGPKALVLMTGGKYTETQQPLRDSVVVNLPVLFTYNAAEAEWSEAQRSADSQSLWTWTAYEPGGHGTRVFAPNPEAMTDVVRFLAENLR